MMNITTFMMLVLIVLSNFITLSANTWLLAWMGLELNLMMMVPLLTLNKGQISPEISIKYFLVQAIGSAFMLSSILIYKTILTENNLLFIQITLTLSLLLKSGAAPLHFWFPSIIEGSSWTNCYIMMTIQKLAPTFLISSLLPSKLILMSVSLSVMMGSMGGLSQTSLKKIMAYSSITYMGWTLMSLYLSNKLFMMFMLMYSVLMIPITLTFMQLNIKHINQINNMNMNILMKASIMMSLMSLGGLPPFLGFIPKLMVIQKTIENKLLFMTTIMVLTSLVTLFYYIKMTITLFVNLPNSIMYLNNNPTLNTNVLTEISMMISILGLFPLSLFIYS